MYPCASGQVSAGAQQPSRAAQGYPILNLFLLANLMTTTSTLPVLLGLLDGPIASRLFTPLSALFGCWFSFASIVVYGRIMLADWGGTMSDVSHLPSPCPAPLSCVACLHLLGNDHQAPVRHLLALCQYPGCTLDPGGLVQGIG